MGLKPTRIQTLRDLLIKEDADIVFLQETKLRAHFFALNKFKLDFQNVFVVDYDGKNGGLALLWKDKVSLEIINYLVNHIHDLITLGSNEVNWEQKYVLTRVYGHPKLFH